MLFQSRELLFRSRKMPFGWLEGVAERRGGSFFGQFLVAFSLLFWLCGFWFSSFLLVSSFVFLLRVCLLPIPRRWLAGIDGLLPCEEWGG